MPHPVRALFRKVAIKLGLISLIMAQSALFVSNKSKSISIRIRKYLGPLRVGVTSTCERNSRVLSFAVFISEKGNVLIVCTASSSKSGSSYLAKSCSRSMQYST